MAYLKGFKETVEKAYKQSAFDLALNSKRPWALRLDDGSRLVVDFVAIGVYEVTVKTSDGETMEIPKVRIELMYLDALADKIEAKLGVDEEVAAQKLQQTDVRGERYHIKNKSIYTPIKDFETFTFTTLAGIVVKGVMNTFTKYEFLVSVGPKLPVILLRHAVHDARDQAGNDLGKEAQSKDKPWRRSRYWVEGDPLQDNKKRQH